MPPTPSLRECLHPLDRLVEVTIGTTAIAKPRRVDQIGAHSSESLQALLTQDRPQPFDEAGLRSSAILIGIDSFVDLRDRKPPTAPDRHDANQET
jgi:hypothetical protein